MEDMRIAGAVRTAAVAVAGLVLVTGCGGGDGGGGGREGGGSEDRGYEGGGAAGGTDGAVPSKDLARIPAVGERWQQRIPADSRQVVVVYGKGVDSADATVELYVKGAVKDAEDGAERGAEEGDTGAEKGDTKGDTKGVTHGAEKIARKGEGWDRTHTWAAHNGRRGWTTDHREGDKRSPVGVFALSDAGGVLPDPGAKLPYTHSAAFTPPSYWAKATHHDFDYVVAVDYNRVRGTSPLDTKRPEGAAEGGGIWLHMDHGSGTSGCVSISKSGMEQLLRTLDPARHPVVVMGDRAHLAG